MASSPQQYQTMSSEPGFDDFKVAWICMTETEHDAALLMLDEKYPELTRSSHDDNRCVRGRIGLHNVVIPVPSPGEYGISAATRTLQHLVRTFTHLRAKLFVGVAGGAPYKNRDIRLGDVVVGVPERISGGVVQYDRGKRIQGGGFQLAGYHEWAPRELRIATESFRSNHEDVGIGEYVEQRLTAMLESGKLSTRELQKYKRPDATTDVLFKTSFLHPMDSIGDSQVCKERCWKEVEHIEIRSSEREQVVVHFGLIGSGDEVIKDAEVRDRWAKEYGVLCFDTEAAGLNSCLVIRGISNYADTHKNDLWQNYAAAIAATYAGELLLEMPTKTIEDIAAEGSEVSSVSTRDQNVRTFTRKK